MPWESKTVDKIREEFIAKAVSGEENFSQLCRQYNISRPTGYKWVERYRQGFPLQDRSHAPSSRPRKTPAHLEALVVHTRNEHPTWGSRKIHRFLLNKGYSQLPAPSTISAILKRQGLISPEESLTHSPWKRFVRDFPNDLWQMDYKGHFGLLDGSRCHPLTILDDHSRFSLCVEAKDNEQLYSTKASVERVFGEFGIPKAILCDNGAPWGDSHNGYTQFEVWLMQLDILPIHGRPMHPQTQGKDERFHRTLKKDLLDRTPLHDMQHAQQAFDKFRYCYNFERPHGALDLNVPAKFYKPSTRPYIEHVHEPEYDSGRVLRKVNIKGYVSINRHRYYLSETFIDKYLEIVPDSQNIVSLCYGDFVIAKIDLSERLFVSRRISRRTIV